MVRKPEGVDAAESLLSKLVQVLKPELDYQLKLDRERRKAKAKKRKKKSGKRKK